MLSSINMEPLRLGLPSNESSRQQGNRGAQTDGKGKESLGPGAVSSESLGLEDKLSAIKTSDQFSVEESSTNGESQQGESSVATAGAGEGSKELLDIKQSEAIGELQDLFQKRADEIEGVFTIETRTASHQKVQVPYLPSERENGDLGGTSSRDEIPIAYRSYIKRYFEMIRQKAIE